MNGDAEKAAALVRAAADLPYEVGLILGTGLGPIAETVTDAVRIPYGDLPGFPLSKVSSHKSELVAGRLEGVPVVVLSGRIHYYESGDAAIMRTPIATLKALGCDTLILTNSAGSVNPDVALGALMVITDHIAFSGQNPLIGELTDRRFVGMTVAYDKGLHDDLIAAAARELIVFGSGVYMWFSGPSFETPAEIRMARMLGADAVGMSTVPEVILARFYGLRVAAVSIITNLAAGITGTELSHEETKAVAPKGAVKLERLIRRYLHDRGVAGGGGRARAR
jgi:purine-nucleoside phosphorylase